MPASRPLLHPQGIIPPYLLETLSKSKAAAPAARSAAQHALDVTRSLQTRRASISVSLRAAARVKPSGPPHKNRLDYTARNTTSLPGALIRSEGQPASGDVALDECYDGLGATFDLFSEIFGRNSIDDSGMDLIGTVHFDESYDNAFWDGSQMVFGDGDGVYFNRFTAAVDVMGHELTHGVTAHTANLEYDGQSGALNESISDVFGSLVKQYLLHQTAADADWIIGAGLFTSQVQGQGLRSMKEPGTAYNDPALGKDPQPADMAHYVNTNSDNGGVHINSGIPNRAFYLAATALGGYAWEKAGRIWYETLCDTHLKRTAEFKDFAKLTVDHAARLFDPGTATAVTDAWSQVGISISGK